METITAIVVAAIGASAGIWAFITTVYEKKHEDKKEESAVLKEIKELKSDIEETNNKVSKLSEEFNEKFNQMSQELKNNNELTKSIGRNELSRLCNKYIKLGFVPLNDHDAFIMLGEDYINNGGNTSVKEKFIKCKDLPIKEDTRRNV